MIAYTLARRQNNGNADTGQRTHRQRKGTRNRQLEPGAPKNERGDRTLNNQKNTCATAQTSISLALGEGRGEAPPNTCATAQTSISLALEEGRGEAPPNTCATAQTSISLALGEGRGEAPPKTCATAQTLTLLPLRGRPGWGRPTPKTPAPPISRSPHKPDR